MVWILLVCVLVAALIIMGARFSYRLAFYNANLNDSDPYVVPPGEQYAACADRMLELIRELDGVAFEQVYITSHDGLKLAARYYHVKDGAPLQIQFHGFHSSGLRDMCGGNRLARKSGFNVLMVDQRAHGISEGHTITFGVKERLDCQDWIQYALDRFGSDTQIILCGISMGAATILMASDLKLPENVRGIIADCPYSSPGEIIRKVGRQMGIPGWLGYPFVMLGGLIYGHFAVWKHSAIKSVRNTQIPILLIHGEADDFVPCYMSKKIHSSCSGHSVLVTVPQAGHGLSYLVQPRLYEKAVADFIRFCGI